MRTFIIIALALLSSIYAETRPIFKADFKLPLSELLHRRSKEVSIESLNDKNILILNQPLEPEKPLVEASFKALDIQGRTKYRLKLRAALRGPDCVELNPQLEYLFFHYNKKAVGKPLPGWRLRFGKKDGSEVGRKLPLFHNVIMHQDWRYYSETFYAPPGAQTLHLVLSNNANTDNKLLIEKIKLERIDDGELNLNADFKAGIEDYSGYNYGLKQRLQQNGENAWRLDANEGWFIGDYMPVEPNLEYKLSVKLETVDKIGRIRVQRLDENLKSLGDLKQTIRESRKGKYSHEIVFMLEENCSWLRLVGSGAYFEIISIRANANQPGVLP